MPVCEWCWQQAKEHAAPEGGTTAFMYPLIIREQETLGVNAECPSARLAAVRGDNQP